MLAPESMISRPRGIFLRAPSGPGLKKLSPGVSESSPPLAGLPGSNSACLPNSMILVVGLSVMRG